MKPNKPDIAFLKKMYAQVMHFKLDLDLLLPGLTILVKDTAAFLTAHGIHDETAEGFRQAHLDMLNHNRYYWQRFGPRLYLSFIDAGLPGGFASDAAKCKVDLSPLSNACYKDDEWLRAPGWHFFQTYSVQRRRDILGEMTLNELKASFCEAKDPYKPIEELVERLAGTERLSKDFWYPVMLFIALLLHKTDFRTLD